MFTPSTRRHASVRAALTAAVAICALALAACSSAENAPTGGTGSASTNKSNIPAPTEDGVKKGLLQVLNPDLKWDSLPAELQSVMVSGDVKLTDEQKSVWEKCMSSPSCDVGTGKYVMAFVDDQVNAYVSMSRGEAMDYAIKSGQVKKIITLQSQADLQQTLANVRSAIAQGANLIIGTFAATGNQLGPVFQLAKKAGIPIINASVGFAPDVAALQTVVFKRDLCATWADAATKLTAIAKENGKSAPTYAIFTGIPGNGYAAQWQPCAQKDLDGQGWKKVYTGTTNWTPQGAVQAASALRASGKKPDAIIYDSSLEDFINAYLDAGEKELPAMVNGGSAYVGQAKAFKKATDAGMKFHLLQAGSDVWMSRIEVSGSLAYLDKSLSTKEIAYPMNVAEMSTLVGTVDLTQDDFTIMGSLLTPEQVAFSIKH